MLKKVLQLSISLGLILLLAGCASSLAFVQENGESIACYPKEVGSTENGKFTGTRYLFYADDKTCGKEFFKDGLREGVATEYYTNGKLKYEGNWIKGKPHGKETWYYNTGVLKEEKTWEHGSIVGLEIKYHENGKKRLVRPYKNDKLNGEIRSYYESGKLYVKETFKDNQNHGIHYTYFENGRVKVELPFTKGKEHGTYMEYYENGKKKKIIPFTMGIINGEVINYHENGQLKDKKLYKNNLIDGLKAYKMYENGKLKYAGDFAQGYLQKKYVYWPNGNIKLEKIAYQFLPKKVENRNVLNYDIDNYDLLKKAGYKGYVLSVIKEEDESYLSNAYYYTNGKLAKKDKNIYRYNYTDAQIKKLLPCNALIQEKIIGKEIYAYLRPYNAYQKLSCNDKGEMYAQNVTKPKERVAGVTNQRDNKNRRDGNWVWKDKSGNVLWQEKFYNGLSYKPSENNYSVGSKLGNFFSGFAKALSLQDRKDIKGYNKTSSGVNEGEENFTFNRDNECEFTVSGLSSGEKDYANLNGDVCKITNRKAGLKDGKEIWFHDNGKLAALIDHKKGMMHGTLTSYYANGNLKEKGDFKEHVLNKNYIRYDQKGNKLIEIERLAEDTLKYTIYSPAGDIMKFEGKLLSYNFYDKDDVISVQKIKINFKDGKVTEDIRPKGKFTFIKTTISNKNTGEVKLTEWDTNILYLEKILDEVLSLETEEIFHFVRFQTKFD